MTVAREHSHSGYAHDIHHSRPPPRHPAVPPRRADRQDREQSQLTASDNFFFWSKTASDNHLRERECEIQNVSCYLGSVCMAADFHSWGFERELKLVYVYNFWQRPSLTVECNRFEDLWSKRAASPPRMSVGLSAALFIHTLRLLLVQVRACHFGSVSRLLLVKARREATSLYSFVWTFHYKTLYNYKWKILYGGRTGRERESPMCVCFSP